MHELQQQQHQLQAPTPPQSPQAVQLQAAQLQAEHNMLMQQQLAARQSQMEALAQHQHAQQLMHSAQPAHSEQQAIEVDWQSQTYSSTQDAGAASHMAPTQGEHCPTVAAIHYS